MPDFSRITYNGKPLPSNTPNKVSYQELTKYGGSSNYNPPDTSLLTSIPTQAEISNIKPPNAEQIKNRPKLSNDVLSYYSGQQQSNPLETPVTYTSTDNRIIIHTFEGSPLSKQVLKYNNNLGDQNFYSGALYSPSVQAKKNLLETGNFIPKTENFGAYESPPNPLRFINTTNNKFIDYLPPSYLDINLPAKNIGQQIIDRDISLSSGFESYINNYPTNIFPSYLKKSFLTVKNTPFFRESYLTSKELVKYGLDIGESTFRGGFANTMQDVKNIFKPLKLPYVEPSRFATTGERINYGLIEGTSVIGGAEIGLFSKGITAGTGTYFAYTGLSQSKTGIFNIASNIKTGYNPVIFSKNLASTIIGAGTFYLAGEGAIKQSSSLYSDIKREELAKKNFVFIGKETVKINGKNYLDIISARSVDSLLFRNVIKQELRTRYEVIPLDNNSFQLRAGEIYTKIIEPKFFKPSVPYESTATFFGEGLKTKGYIVIKGEKAYRLLYGEEPSMQMKANVLYNVEKYPELKVPINKKISVIDADVNILSKKTIIRKSFFNTKTIESLELSKVKINGLVQYKGKGIFDVVGLKKIGGVDIPSKLNIKYAIFNGEPIMLSKETKGIHTGNFIPESKGIIFSGKNELEFFNIMKKNKIKNVPIEEDLTTPIDKILRDIKTPKRTIIENNPTGSSTTILKQEPIFKNLGRVNALVQNTVENYAIEKSNPFLKGSTRSTQIFLPKPSPTSTRLFQAPILKQELKQDVSTRQQMKQSPIFKNAFAYSPAIKQELNTNQLFKQGQSFKQDQLLKQQLKQPLITKQKQKIDLFSPPFIDIPLGNNFNINYDSKFKKIGKNLLKPNKKYRDYFTISEGFISNALGRKGMKIKEKDLFKVAKAYSLPTSLRRKPIIIG